MWDGFEIDDRVECVFVDPGNPKLEHTLLDMGKRRRPGFPMLRRGHALNRIAGLLLHRWGAS